MSVKPPAYADHLACYAFASRLVWNKKILEIGCGEGLGAQMMSLFAHTISGVDNSPQAIGRCGNKKYHCGTAFGVHDLEKETFTAESFDFVVAFEVLEHISNPEQILEIISRSRTPIVFSVPHNHPHALHKRNFFSLDDAKAMVEPFFYVTWYVLRRGGLIENANGQEDVLRYVGVGTPRMLQ